MGAPAGLKPLVDKFRSQQSAYKSVTYKEARVRGEFIDPLLELLGWDINNAGKLPEHVREVIPEPSIDIGGHAKAPDYEFRIAGDTVFFGEAKKPSVNLKDNLPAAYQLRRYGWSKSLSISILTDFEELAIYDCRIRPKSTDKAFVARIKYYDFEQYESHWDEIAGLLSRDAVLGGSLDQYVTTKKRRGTEQVNSEFLKEIEGWRTELAKSVALKNKGLDEREINQVVQRTIDRIIFLRICEAREIEKHGTLQQAGKGAQTYSNLTALFRAADAKYNSGLFHFAKERDRSEPPDTLALSVSIDDAPLKKLLKHLYYPYSPYEFSVLPADILGQVYEQFLGGVIRLTKGHQAKVELKPEVRKAGGVFYTPTFIVKHIVQSTLGASLAGKRPGKRSPVNKLRVLDAACGSGSFLISAYQYLLDWHRDQYALKPAKHKEVLYQAPNGVWRLTTEEKKRILRNNIYGVDIDPQAVEVTKLSLLLKVLEGETAQTIAKQLQLFKERALPDLANNIKCGNSLISPDKVYHDQTVMFQEEEEYRINAFDWEAEFPTIMKDGGFDCVIGNPPYIRIQHMTEWAPVEVAFYKSHYATASKGSYDIYVVFVEKCLALLKKTGQLGFILPHKFFNLQYGEHLRGLLSQGLHLKEIVHFGDLQVFENATTYTCLLFLSKTERKSFTFTKVNDLIAWRRGKKQPKGRVTASKATSREWTFVIGPGAKLFETLDKMPTRLGDVATRMFQGSITSADTVFLFKDSGQVNPKAKTTQVYSSELDETIELETELLRAVVRSGHVGGYTATPTALVLFPYKVHKGTATLYSQNQMRTRFPKAWAYLKRNKKLLKERERSKFDDSSWYRFGRTQNLAMWDTPKLMVPYMITDLGAYYDEDDNYVFINVTTGGYGITVDDKTISYHYLCALLNSRLLDFYLKCVSTNFHGGYLAANKQFIERIPIFLPKTRTDRNKQKRIEKLAKELHDLKRKEQGATGHQQTTFARRIQTKDKVVNRLVYELYDVGSKDIAALEKLRNTH